MFPWLLYYMVENEESAEGSEMARKHSLEKWMSGERPKGTRITNDDLQCRDCRFRRDDSVIEGNTSRCDIYPVSKPTQVLNGKGKCTYHEKGEYEAES